MKINTRAMLVLVAAAIVAAGAPHALAQGTGPRRGSDGVFGGGPSDASAHQKLDLTLSPTQGYDSDLVPTLGTPIGPESTGYSTTLVGTADYSWQIGHVQIRASDTSTLRYNRPLDSPLYSSFRSVSHTAGVGVFARLPKQTTMLVNQTATYSPSFLFNLFPQAPANIPGDAPPAALDYAMNGSASHAYGTAMTFTHDFTRRNSLMAIADYQNTDTPGGISGRLALSSYGIRSRFAHRVAPNTAAIAEYLYRSSGGARGGGVATAQTSSEHGVNVGVDYSRRLSASRHMTFSALIGSSITIVPQAAVSEPAALDSTVPDSALPESAVAIGDRYYRQLSGQVTMGYEFARTWKAGAIYRRGVDYVIGLNQPISADSFTASVAGLLTRRVDVLASAGYSNGQSALTLQRSTFKTYTGDFRLRYALTRTFAAYGEYLYYFYDSHGSTPIAPGISTSGLERKGVRAGLTLRVPALRR